MQYRQFGKLDWKVSALGFGTMRLPLLDENPSHVDEAEAIRMLHYAIDHGVNYIDTAYLYHEGRSEVIVGKALHDGYREKVRLATKLPATIVDSVEDFDRVLNEQMERLQTDHIDFYLLHGLNKKYWYKIRDLGVMPWAENLIKDGRILHLGFSFHDELIVFKEIVDYYDKWDFCQIQYNYVDQNHQAGIEGLRYAANRGLGVVVMEPLRGGGLTRNLPEQVDKLWANATTKRSLAQWGLLWLWNQPEVSVVLSGMSAMEQVVENVASTDHCKPGTITPVEVQLISQVGDAYRGLHPVPCTNCRYCMPCPNGVAIPHIFALYNDANVHNTKQVCSLRYSKFTINEDQRADNCIECGECAEKCPQSIDIPNWLKKAHELLYITE